MFYNYLLDKLKIVFTICCPQQVVKTETDKFQFYVFMTGNKIFKFTFEWDEKGYIFNFNCLMKHWKKTHGKKLGQYLIITHLFAALLIKIFKLLPVHTSGYSMESF